MTSIITVKNISKKYNITHQQGGYVALRDVLTNVAKSPFKFAKHKAKQAIGKAGKEEFWALKDINFEIEKGEAIGIIGANGAGKSTLLKILTGITPPTTGEIRMRGKVASLLEVGTGFHPELTGRENIFLNGAIMGMTKKEIADKFNDIVEFAGINKFIDTPVKRYSSGMYVRLAFSVAAHMEPDILLVDEVLAVGDAEFQKKCLGKMDEVTKQAGRTILFVSHNMNAIQNLCKRCILLRDGRIEMIGETKKVIKKYLSDQSNDSTIGIWRNKDKEYDTEYIRPLKLEITDKKGCSKKLPLSSNKQVFISAQVQVKKTDPILNIAYALYDNERNLLYWSASTDKEQKNWLKIEEGRVRILAEIPSQILNDGLYYLEFMSSLHNKMWIHKPGNGPAINFTIKKMSSDSERIMINRPGIITPELEWKIEK